MQNIWMGFCNPILLLLAHLAKLTRVFLKTFGVKARPSPTEAIIQVPSWLSTEKTKGKWEYTLINMMGLQHLWIETLYQQLKNRDKNNIFLNKKGKNSKPSREIYHLCKICSTPMIMFSKVLNKEGMMSKSLSDFTSRTKITKTLIVFWTRETEPFKMDGKMGYWELRIQQTKLLSFTSKNNNNRINIA